MSNPRQRYQYNRLFAFFKRKENKKQDRGILRLLNTPPGRFADEKTGRLAGCVLDKSLFDDIVLVGAADGGCALRFRRGKKRKTETAVPYRNTQKITSATDALFSGKSYDVRFEDNDQ